MSSNNPGCDSRAKTGSAVRIFGKGFASAAIRTGCPQMPHGFFARTPFHVPFWQVPCRKRTAATRALRVGNPLPVTDVTRPPYTNSHVRACTVYIGNLSHLSQSPLQGESVEQRARPAVIAFEAASLQGLRKSLLTTRFFPGQFTPRYPGSV
jgi:hypothetical protein